MSETLKPASFYILLALADRNRHGYAIMQAIRERSGGRFAVRTASFYRHLARLIEAGLVVESAIRPAEDDPRRGAYYELTPAGHAALAGERARLEDLLAAANAWAPDRMGRQ